MRRSEFGSECLAKCVIFEALCVSECPPPCPEPSPPLFFSSLLLLALQNANAYETARIEADFGLSGVKCPRQEAFRAPTSLIHNAGAGNNALTKASMTRLKALENKFMDDNEWPDRCSLLYTDYPTCQAVGVYNTINPGKGQDFIRGATERHRTVPHRTVYPMLGSTPERSILAHTYTRAPRLEDGEQAQHYGRAR